jgi:membrane protein YdbS with pleckstrin-like domain
VDVRPHWRFLARPAVAVAAASGGSIAALIEGVPRLAELAVAALLVVCLLWLAGRWVRWATTSFVVTTARVVVRQGALRRTGREVLLDRVTDISYSRSLLDRLTGAGDVLLQTAGRDSPEVLACVPRPLQAHDAIAGLVADRVGGRGMAWGPPTGWPAPEAHQQAGAGGPSGVTEQLAQLDELRRRGVISRREFASKKAELLSRL